MKTTKIPIYILVGFNFFTWLIYLSNPFANSVSEMHNYTILYVLLNILMLYWGLKQGVKSGNRLNPRRIIRVKTFFKKYMTPLFVFYILTFSLKYAYELRVPVFDIPALINRIAMGITSPDLGYALTLTGSQSFPWSLYMMMSIVDGAFFIIGMLCWDYLSKFQKSIFVLLAVIDVLKWFGAGTSFGIMQMLSTLLLVYVISIKSNQLTRKQIIKYIFVGGVLFIFAITAFGINMEGRAGGSFTDIKETDINTDSFFYHYFVSILPKWFQDMYQFIARYLVGGYYNLELAFTADYDWCFFLGRNNALTRIADDFLHIGIEPINLQHKIYQMYGIDPYIYWHSIYTWLANDFTLFGVPIVVYVIGKLTSMTLMVYTKYNDMISGVIFILLANCTIYFFANNNYLSGHYYVFLGFVIIWLTSRYSFSRR